MKQDEFNELFNAKTKKLALNTIAVVSDLKYSDALGVIRKQLIWSVTSVAANYRAVCRARSEKEKYAKLCIVVEEADETLFWIEMLIDGGFTAEEKLFELRNESEEILKVMSSYRSKLKPINY